MLLVDDHEDVVVVVAKLLNDLFLMRGIDRGRRGSEVHMRVTLHPDVVKHVVVLIEQPHLIGCLVCVDRGTSYLLGVDEDVVDKEAILSSIDETVPSYLAVKQIDQQVHLRIGSRGERHSCSLVLIGLETAKSELKLQPVCCEVPFAQSLAECLEQFVFHFFCKRQGCAHFFSSLFLSHSTAS